MAILKAYPYRKIVVVVVFTWLVAAAVSIAIGVSREDLDIEGALTVGQIGIIVVASGWIAIASTTPGWRIRIPDTSQAVGSETESESASVSHRTLGERSGREPSEHSTGESRMVDESGFEENLGSSDKETQGKDALLSPWAIAMERLGNAFLIGMMIRLFGTVALFLASSYYMEAPATRLAIWILSWHMVLLASEVAALSRVMASQ